MTLLGIYRFLLSLQQHYYYVVIIIVVIIIVVFIQVRSNDTLASIALKFNTTRSELTRMNRLSSSLLYPGQVGSYSFL